VESGVGGEMTVSSAAWAGGSAVSLCLPAMLLGCGTARVPSACICIATAHTQQDLLPCAVCNAAFGSFPLLHFILLRSSQLPHGTLFAKGLPLVLPAARTPPRHLTHSSLTAPLPACAAHACLLRWLRRAILLLLLLLLSPQA
jgi:hypothetical protein